MGLYQPSLPWCDLDLIIILYWLQKFILRCFLFNISTDCLLLCASVEGPCPHRPENWLVRQPNDEPKPVYKVGFIREKERLQLEKCSGAQKLVAHCSGEG
jgi:hypothetical protein